MRSRTSGLLALAATGLFVVAGNSWAVTLELPRQDFAISADPSATETTPGSVSASRTLTFDKFDPSLGTLTGVRIGMASSVDLALQVTADPVGPADGFGGSARLVTNLRLDADGVGTLLSFSHTVNADCTGGPGDSCSDLVLDLNNYFGGSYFTDDPSLLANFVMSGMSATFAVSPFADLALTITGCSGGLAGAPVDVDCSANASLDWLAYRIAGEPLPMVGVTYEYLARVPEPGTLALLGLGLAGLGLARRHRAR